MDLLQNIIDAVSKEEFAKLDLPELTIQKTIINAIRRKYYSLVDSIFTKVKITPNFGVDHYGSVADDGALRKPNPLFTALAASDARMVALLVKHGAKLDIISPRDTNVVHFALEKNMIATAILFVKKGAKVNTLTKNAKDFIPEATLDKVYLLDLLLEEEAAATKLAAFVTVPVPTPTPTPTSASTVAAESTVPSAKSAECPHTCTGCSSFEDRMKSAGFGRKTIAGYGSDTI